MSVRVARRPAICALTLGIAVAVSLMGLAGVAFAQEAPRPGGELVFVVPAEPPSFDAHREESLSLIRPAKEAGVPDGFAFTFRNRAIGDPYEPLAAWLVDQWRQIGRNNNQLDTVWLAPE